MLVPISWLKEFVSFNLSAEEVAEKFTSIGFEVENIIYQNKLHNNVIVGEIVEFTKHPNADKLTVCKINIGDKIIQVITNIKICGGEIVAVALDGAILSQNFKIKAGDLRGVLSEGMLCGLKEISLSGEDVDHQLPNDIIRFKSKKLVGTNVFDALGYNDIILDISITANRGDCNSIYRLARELAVVLRKPVKKLDLSFNTKQSKLILNVENYNKEICPRYMASIVDNIKIKKSPKKIMKRLRAVGISPINNIVDLTNYILYELGQPMHAFDYDKIQEHKIVVRNAQNKEKVVLLNDNEYELSNNDIVISDANQPIALAGIMGGSNSCINETTERIVLESANFPRDLIRKTSKKLNVRSDSSARFEKSLDYTLQEIALKRMLHYISKFSYGDITNQIFDVKENFKKYHDLTFKINDLEKILGISINVKELDKILSLLEFKITKKEELYKVKISEERNDINTVNDIAEEYVRFVGYNNIKSTLFKYAEQTVGGKDAKEKFIDKIKNILISFSLHEILTYSFISTDFSDKLLLSHNDPQNDVIKLMNPLSEAVACMRPSLIYSVLNTVSYNLSHSNRDFGIFEIAKTYYKNPEFNEGSDLPTEESKLVCALVDKDIHDLTQILKMFCDGLRLNMHLEQNTRPYLHPGRTGQIIINNEVVGEIGEVHPQVSDQFNLNAKVSIFELSVDKIFKLSTSNFKLKTYSKFPIIERDLAVVINEDVPAWKILNVLSDLKISELIEYELFDEYKGDNIEAGKKSIAMHFNIQGIDKNLVDNEIDEIIKRIMNKLEEKFGAVIR